MESLAGRRTPRDEENEQSKEGRRSRSMCTDNEVKKELYHDLKLSDPQSEMSNLAIKIARNNRGTVDSG
jgi:hypothetical protein